MRTHAILSVLVMIILTGCTKSDGPTSSTSVGPNAIFFLSGQISDWGYGTHRTIALTYPDSTNLLRVCSSSKINSLGFFSIQNLISPPLSSKAFPAYPSLVNLGQILENTFACTDSSAKIIYGELKVGNDTSSDWVGFVVGASYNINQPTKNGDFLLTPCFVTKDVKLSGTIKSRLVLDTYQIEEIAHYDLSFTRGWNQEVYTFLSQSAYTDSSKTFQTNEYSLTNLAPYQVRWTYVNY